MFFLPLSPSASDFRWWAVDDDDVDDVDDVDDNDEQFIRTPTFKFAHWHWQADSRCALKTCPVGTQETVYLLVGPCTTMGILPDISYWLWGTEKLAFLVLWGVACSSMSYRVVLIQCLKWKSHKIDNKKENHLPSKKVDDSVRLTDLRQFRRIGRKLSPT